MLLSGGGKAGREEGSPASTQRQEVPELLYRKALPGLTITAENQDHDNGALRNGSKFMWPGGVI